MRSKDNTTLKQLKTQQAKLMGSIEAVKVEVANLQKDLSSKQKAVQEIQKKIYQLEHPTEISISEHAIVRFFERIQGYDPEEVKRNILTEKVRQLINELGPNGTYPTGQHDNKGIEYRVKVVDNVIVTILT